MCNAISYFVKGGLNLHNGLVPSFDLEERSLFQLGNAPVFNVAESHWVAPIFHEILRSCHREKEKALMMRFKRRNTKRLRTRACCKSGVVHHTHADSGPRLFYTLSYIVSWSTLPHNLVGYVTGSARIVSVPFISRTIEDSLYSHDPLLLCHAHCISVKIARVGWKIGLRTWLRCYAGLDSLSRNSPCRPHVSLNLVDRDASSVQPTETVRKWQ
jgi:hypothetical protein